VAQWHSFAIGEGSWCNGIGLHFATVSLCGGADTQCATLAGSRGDGSAVRHVRGEQRTHLQFATFAGSGATDLQSPKFQSHARPGRPSAAPHARLPAGSAK
jgi:hypothetical protein